MRSAGALLLALGALAACVPGSDGPRDARREVQAPWFAEEAALRGLAFEHDAGRGEIYRLPEITAGGAALFDADGDGDLDAYLVQFDGVATPLDRRGSNRLFMNDGKGRFSDVTEGSGAGVRTAGNGVACGDFDGDGSVDLYLTNLGPDLLLRNDGRGRFVDATLAAGLGQAGWGSSAAFFDMEGDGDLDLFVARYLDWSEGIERDCPGAGGRSDYCQPSVYAAPSSDLLYRNEGGVFTDISESSGITALRGTGLGVLPMDFDGDGRMDVFVANDGMPDRLWIQFDEGRFEDRALLLGCAVDEEGQAKAGMGVAAADLDGDGDLELLIGNLTGESDSLFRNELVPGGGRFDDVTVRAGLSGVSRSRTRFGLGFFDFDQDGELDLFEANGRVTRPPSTTTGDPYAEENLLLRGEGGLRFSAPLPHAGLRSPLVATSRAAAFGDVDGDGAIDALIVNRDGPVHLLRNVVRGRGHWLLFDLRDEKGAPALGAVITVTGGGRNWRGDVRAAGSYQASSDPRVHFGLGALTHIDSVSILWPDGTREELPAPPLNTLVPIARSP